MTKHSVKIFNLTARETTAAAFLGRGMSRKEIASRMSISVRTVDDYIFKIRQKVDAPSMFAAGCILSHYRIRIPPA